MTRATLEAQLAARPGVRPFTVTRAGGPGLQRYAQTWSGDNTTSWESLRWNFRTGLGMSLSGLFNIGHDVGGFAGPAARPGAPDPLDAGGAHPSALYHEQLEGRRRRDLALAAPGGAADDPRGAAAALAAHAVSLQRDGLGARGACPRAQADVRRLRGRPGLLRRRRRRDVRAEPARRAGSQRRGARGRGLSPRGPESWRDIWTGGVLRPAGA